MTKVSVYIATTNGPVQVELISTENIPRSEVVLSGDFVPLDDLSSEYHHFATGSGPVSRAFGPFNSQSFHMEISAAIDSGRSWHLAALIANGFNEKQELAAANEIPDKIILATGRIENSFEIISEHIEQKLEKSDGLFQYAEEHDIPIEIIGPKEKFPKNFERNNVSIQEIINAYEALDICKLKYHKQTPTTSMDDNQKNEKLSKKMWMRWTASLVFLIIIGFAVSQVVETQTLRLAFKDFTSIVNKSEKKGQKVGQGSLTKMIVFSVKVYEVHSATNSNCAEVHLGQTPGDFVPLEKLPNGLFVSPITKTLCGINIQFDQEDKKNLLILKMESGKFAGRDYNQNIELLPDQKNIFNIPRNAKNKIAYSLILKNEAEKPIILTHEIVSP